MKIIKQNIKLYKMVNKNGGLNKIVEGIKKGAKFLHPVSGRFGALRKGKMIKNSLVNLKKKKALKNINKN